MRRSLSFLALLIAFPALAAPEVTWERLDYDPGPEVDGSVPAADLILPLPCGGAIALMEVRTEARADNPLDDQSFRMGAPDPSRAPYEYIRQAHIRGAFADAATNTTHYYIGRYEVSRAQHAAISAWAAGDDCPTPNPDEGPLPMTEISWFDAHRFTVDLSTWARSELGELMPKTDARLGFFRLPSEAEWEFATRGGLATKDKAEFNALRFQMDGKLRDYAWHDGRVSSQGELQFIGTLKPNPLGIFDVYGNAEEMVADLFTVNSGGRRGGQYGGFVTRGGSYRNKPSEIRSSTRTEYSFYDAREPGPSTFRHVGLRIVLSNQVLTSDRVMFDLEDAWSAELDPADRGDPRGLLTRMIEEEAELAKRSDLEALQSALVTSLNEAKAATELAMRRAVFGGAALYRSITSLRPRRDVVAASIEATQDDISFYEAEIATLQQQEGMEGAIAIYQEQLSHSSDRLAQSRDRLVGYNRDLDIDGTNFVATVDAVLGSSSTETLRGAADLLVADMSRSDQLEIIEPIEVFVRVVEAYRENPSMARDEILAFP